MAQDPGWRPPRGLLVKALSTPWSVMQSGTAPVLVNLRTLFLVTPLYWLIFLALIWAVEVTPGSALWPAALVVALGAFDIAVAQRLRVRALAGDTAQDLATSFRATRMIGWALSNGMAVFGFALYFVTGRVWIFLLALPFATVLLRGASPTTRSLRDDQRHIAESGRDVSLAEAAMLPMSSLPKATLPRKRG